jgi:hypothetical protein
MQDIDDKISEQIRLYGRTDGRKLLQWLLNSKHKMEIEQLIAKYPGLRVKAYIEIYKNGGHRPKCKNCGSKYTTWQARGKGRFAEYCSAKCQNSSDTKLLLQIESHKKYFENTNNFVKQVYKDFKDEEINFLTDEDIRVLTNAINSTPAKREHEILKLLPIKYVKIWVNLPEALRHRNRVKLLIATGKIPLKVFCEQCNERVLTAKFENGWTKCCSASCMAKLNVPYRITPDSIEKSRISNEQFYARNPEKALDRSNRLKNWALKNHGVENVSQVPGIVKKRVKSLYWKYKDYNLGNRVVKILGYENYALDELVKKYDPNSIIVDTDGTVPNIKYVDKLKGTHIFYPDIFIEKINTLIEVKSTWTFLKDEKAWLRNCAKYKAAKKAGYKIIFFVYAKKGIRIKLPNKWYRKSYEEIQKYIKKS